jgi:hypothetical protein
VTFSPGPKKSKENEKGPGCVRTTDVKMGREMGKGILVASKYTDRDVETDEKVQG